MIDEEIAKKNVNCHLIFFLITELILRDSTNAGNQVESSPAQAVQKRQHKKKKRRTADSYSDISFNDKYKLTEELLGTGAHGYVIDSNRVFFMFVH